MKAALLLIATLAIAQQPKTYLVKLSTPVNSKKNKAGDPIRAMLISPESYLNGYVEGTIERAGKGTLLLRFAKLVYKGNSKPLQTEVVDWVNSKGHKSVDDEERAVTLNQGELRTTGPELWLDEGSEIRIRINEN